MLKKLLLLLFIIFFSVENTTAQNLAGFWNGKISRKSALGYGADNLEIHIYQSGRDIWGYTFAYTDTNRFVLYKFNGTFNKKEKKIDIQEFGVAFAMIPDQFFPCEKKFDLKYTRINNTKYLTGKWSGVIPDTACYPDNELLVAVQKVNLPLFKEDMDIVQKINHFFTNRKEYAKSVQEKPEAEITQTIAPDSAKIKLLDRRLDIQQILAVRDTAIFISLYDNAINDGDTVSVFLNKKPFIIKQRISNRPLQFSIPFTNKNEAIELLFQAENLGEIPPNTGVMIVEADGKRYEIRVQSDFEKHAVIIFTPDG